MVTGNFTKRAVFLILTSSVLFFISIFSGCSLKSGYELDSLEMAEITSLSLDYQSMKLEGEKAAMEVDALNNADMARSGSRSVYGVDDPDYILDDGTEVYVTREYEDNDTPGNVEDDYIVITRQFYIDTDLLEFTEVLNLSVKPEADWSVWDEPVMLNDDGSFSQEGSITRYIGDTGGSSIEGDMRVTWVKVEEEVELYSIVKESVALMNMTTVITTITFDAEDNPVKEQLRIRIVDGDEIVVNSFVYTQFEEDGFTKTKMIREDGAFCLRWRDTEYVDPSGEQTPAWIQEYYNENGILRSKRIETGYRIVREVLVYIYDESGTEIIDTRSMDVRFSGNIDGSVDVEKILDNGKLVILNIIESDEGYTITKDGYTYMVTVDLMNGIVEFFNEYGTFLGKVIIGDDGSYDVEMAGDDSERIEI
ncbi:MAG TPA: hypothetical protein DCO79_07555 [Spirochaeta sp.]|nr:hypothetical protein [Spirochaeta sp.]